MKIIAILSALAAVATIGAAAPAEAQSCRFAGADNGATICVCWRGGGWRIQPNRACQGAPPRRLSAEDERQRRETREIQTVLNAIDCDAGKPDGLAGRKTRAAIRCFQQATRQPETGALTDEERALLLDSYDRLPEPGFEIVERLRVALAPPSRAPAPDREIEAEAAPAVAATDASPAAALGLAPAELIALCRRGLDSPPDTSPSGFVFEKACLAQAEDLGEVGLAAAYEDRLNPSAPPAAIEAEAPPAQPVSAEQACRPGAIIGDWVVEDVSGAATIASSFETSKGQTIDVTVLYAGDFKFEFRFAPANAEIFGAAMYFSDAVQLGSSTVSPIATVGADQESWEQITMRAEAEAVLRSLDQGPLRLEIVSGGGAAAVVNDGGEVPSATLSDALECL